jgi:outer membrane protein assembly factor BamB
MSPDPADRNRLRRLGSASVAIPIAIVGVALVVAVLTVVVYRDLIEDFNLEIDAPPCMGALTGFDAATGDRTWRRPLGSDTEFIAEVADAVVALDDGGSLHGVDGRTGAVAWTVPAVGSDAITAVGDGMLFALEPGANGSLTAIELAGGTSRWSVPIAIESTSFLTELAAGPGTVLVADTASATGGTSVTAFDASTGAVRWTGSPSTPFVGLQVPNADVILATGWGAGAGVGSVLALDAASGVPRWTLPAVLEEGEKSAFALSPGAVAGSTVGIARTVHTGDGDAPDAVGGRDGTLFVDVATGTPRWETSSTNVGGDNRASFAFDPEIAGGTLFERGAGGMLVARDPLTGSVRWQHRAPFGYVLTAGDTVFLADTILQSYDATTGEQRWSTRVGRHRDGAPVALVDDVVVVAEDNEGPCTTDDGRFIPDDN